MPKSPLCSKCPVISAISQLRQEYLDFHTFLSSVNLERLTDHARGYCHGQLKLADALDGEFAEVLSVVRVSAALRAAKKYSQ